MSKLIGPFTQLLTMNGISLAGPVRDDEMEIIRDAGILLDGNKIVETGKYSDLIKNADKDSLEVTDSRMVALPGFIDAHTHLCFAGNRAEEYSMRIAGENYSTILSRGGGIHQTVTKTRSATFSDLMVGLAERAGKHFREGVTTMEVKSGYGLNAEEEIRILKVIRETNNEIPADLVSTCLAAHVVPPEFPGEKEYLDYLSDELLPRILKENLCSRVDIFIEKNAFSSGAAEIYLSNAMKLGFEITIHADQFTKGGSSVAAKLKARSADHLEASEEEEIYLLAKNGVAAVVLPGSSLGLGMPFAKARKILDNGGSLVIASDWNPGSAPMGDLLTQASVLSAFEKLSNAETFAAMTYRAAKALNRNDIGIVAGDKKADFIAFDTPDFREILYHQGQLKPGIIWKNGLKFKSKN